MIVVILNILINGLLLMIVTGFSLTIFGFGNQLNWHITNSNLILISYSSVILITLFGISPLGQRLSQLFLNIRDIMPQEDAKLAPILQKAQQIIQNEVPNYKNKRPIKLIIGNNNFNTMQAFGNSTIIVSNMLLNTTGINEIQALFIREIGHIHYKHSIILLGFWYSSLPTILFIHLFLGYKKIQNLLVTFIRNTAPKALVIITITLYLTTLLFMPIIILYWISKHTMNIGALYIKRKYEHIADQFTAKLGYKHDLITFLSKIEIIESTNLQPKFTQLLSTQVNAASRINKLYSY